MTEDEVTSILHNKHFLTAVKNVPNKEVEDMMQQLEAASDQKQQAKKEAAVKVEKKAPLHLKRPSDPISLVDVGLRAMGIKDEDAGEEDQQRATFRALIAFQRWNEVRIT